MDPKRWEKLESLVEQALALPAEQREEFLSDTCGGDAELRREAESLLSHSDQALKFMRDFSDKVITPSLSEVKAQQDQPGRDGQSAPINKTIAHYHITEKLGEGGMGVVYKARDTKLDRTVALKCLPQHLIASEKNKQRFIREAKAAAALDHPNICTLYEINETESAQHFLVMACYKGNTLKEKLKKGPLSLKEALDYTSQIIDGLTCAHQAGVIHRDVKPGNIMVTEDGVVKILDFGIAKMARSDQSKTGYKSGTLAYMSPEQIRGEQVDHRSDLWALGVVLYEMLTGKHPFAGGNDATVLHSILNKEPQPLGELFPDNPRAVQKIVWKLLRKDPSERYQHAGEIIDDIQHMQEEEIEQIFKKKPVSKSNKSFLYGIPILILFLLGMYFFAGDRILAPDIGNSIAVLPLENLSPDPEDAYIADGVHEEIISSLSGIGALTVIARSSVRDYSPEGRNLAQIGRELGVSTLMEGTVRRSGDRIRVYVNLIDADNQSMIWSDTYEDHVQDVFGLQSRIAREITQTLQATLTASEQQRLEQQPTDNPQAYLFYMQARDYLSRPRTEENPLAAERLLRRALEEDPRFAHAYALLAVANSDLYWFQGQSPEHLQQMREAAERAELLAPDLAETKLALGLYYYWSETDHERTLSHFESALQQFPNHPVLHHFTALTHRKLGNWDQAEYHYERAVELDPRNPNHYQELAFFYYFVRKYDEALHVSERALEMSPDASAPVRNINAWIVLEADGTLDGFENWREEITPSDPAVVAPVQWGYFYYYWKRDWDNALRSFNNISSNVVWELEALILLRDYLIATVYDHKGDRTTALEYYDQARLYLEALREEYPDIPRYRAMLGRIYARMGQPEKAIQEGKIATEMMPLHKNALEGASYNTDLAYIYAWSGHHEEAIDKLELLLSIPAPDIHINRLRLNPDWDPLRDHPRFQALIAEDDEPL